MQNYEQRRLIMDWERDHYRLGQRDVFGRAKRRDEG